MVLEVVEWLGIAERVRVGGLAGIAGAAGSAAEVEMGIGAESWGPFGWAST